MVEVVAAENSVVCVAGRVACVAKHYSEDSRGKAKKGEGEKQEQLKAVLQGGRVTDIQA